jgi:sporulation protein YlmC with PRC-barrel domain
MKKILIISACFLPFVIAPAAYAQTGQPATPRTAPAPGAPGTPAAPGAPGMPGGMPGSRTMPTPAAPPAQTISGWSVKHKVMGKTVFNEKDVKIGDIDDVVLTPDGKPATLVVGAGGFLGMGAHDVAIPFDKIKERNNKLVLEGYTKDQLKALPEVKVTK